MAYILFLIPLSSSSIGDRITLAQTIDVGSENSCSLAAPAFCDTFDTPHPGGRGGDLDESNWSVARVGGGVNPSQGQVMQWTPALLNRCINHIEVNAPDDFAICNNHYMEAMNDGGDYIYNAIRAKQLFDFTGRTGKFVFEVDAKAAGHGWWVETWIADEPVPGPYVGAPGNDARPRNGIGFVFGACGEGFGKLDKVYLVKDYEVTNNIDLFQGNTQLHVDGCFETIDNRRNKLEIRISPTRFEIWASDAGESDVHRIAWSDTNVDMWSMPLTRGYVSFLHVQYNAEKTGHVANQTYHWDNIGFDGPVYPKARGYDIPDALIDSQDPRFPPGTLNLGYKIGLDGSITTCCDDNGWISYPQFTFDDVDLSDVREARLNLNLWYFHERDSLYYRFNKKNWKIYPHPFPDSNWSARGLSIPISLSDLVPGKNTLELKATGEEDFVAANISLELDLTLAGGQNKHFLPLLILK
jgi:hypothetical protein